MTLLSVNVRKGDAHLLRCGESVYLIDTGKKKNYDTLYRVLKENGIDHLTGVILTHSHSDHTGGLKQLVKSDIRIEHVYTSAFFVPEEEDKENPVIKALKKTDLKPEYLKGGDVLPLDGGKLEVLGPLEKSETENCNSLVLLATGGGGSILLTGDMEFPEERSLLNAGRILHADVLKIANHGEGDATSDQLVAAVSPSLALISTNTEDEPDTPDPRVMRLLGTYGIPVAQTQETESGVLVTLRNGEIITEMK
jgi:competence protein ComEC